ncbi:CC0125/CC1285 family lipoprotein [Acinetobacter sp. MD2]|uniref:CC0125/CC1285 family lipoprotein n=1 Tax=Acinetobacter sp. MD2 TaxID=2600066 RepID=UPI002D1F87DE|nr:hypothetical protein [Acinetobacter sp. MD2]MEB3768317.1 hypothetical protein [Acinetobacter sp. MD2]
MNKTLLGLLISAPLALSACSTLSTQPRSFDQLGHFSSYPLNNQTFRIGFKTERDMSYGSAQEIALVKAAQTTLQQGFRYFKVVNDPSNHNQAPMQHRVVYPAPPPMFYPYSPYRHMGFYDPFFNSPQVVTFSDPTEVSYTIVCFKEKQRHPDDAFDASLILKSLGAKYGLSPFGDMLPASTSTTP